MKILIKNLPSKTDLKQFYNLNDSKNFTVKRITYTSNRIVLNCKERENKTLYIPFYMDLNFVDFKNKTFLISIEKKYFPHVVKNVKENLEYIKLLKK